MLKREEMSNPNSCLNRAVDDEPIFVLRAKDKASFWAVNMWIQSRMLLGMNQPNDEKIISAMDWLEKAVEWHKNH